MNSETFLQLVSLRSLLVRRAGRQTVRRCLGYETVWSWKGNIVAKTAPAGASIMKIPPSVCRTKPSRFAALGFAILAIDTTGCLTEPDGAVLTGEFGGANIGLTATITEARFEFPCGNALTEPLRFDAAGTAHARGVFHSTAAGAHRIDMTVDAQYLGTSLLQVTVRFGEGEPSSYELRRNEVPEFEGTLCLASTLRQSTGWAEV